MWREHERGKLASQRRAQARLDGLQEQRDTVVGAFLYRRVIDEATYRREVERLDAEIREAQDMLHRSEEEELNVEAVVTFAEQLMADASGMWRSADLDQKQRLQKALFPEGVTYSPEGRFVTAGVAPVS